MEKDPRSSDFGKIKIGDTRYDIWAGFSQLIRFFAQFSTAQKKNTTDGQIIEMDGKKFPFKDRSDIIKNFARTKLSPTAGTMVDLMTGKDMLGNEITVGGEVAKNLIPLYLQDVASLYEKEGPTGLTQSMVPAFFGIGVQNYSAKPGKKKEEKEGDGVDFRF